MDFNMDTTEPEPWYSQISLSHLWVMFVLSASCWFFMKFFTGRNAMRHNLRNTQQMLENIQREMEKKHPNWNKDLTKIDEKELLAELSEEIGVEKDPEEKKSE